MRIRLSSVVLPLAFAACAHAGPVGPGRGGGVPAAGPAFDVDRATLGHLGFPSAARLPDGRLLVAYREGASHADPSGRILVRTGTPDGSAWEPPRVAIDTPGVDDRDPSLAVLPDGEVLLTFFAYRREMVDGQPLVLHAVLASRSADGGRTFDAPVPADTARLESAGVHPDGKGLWLDPAGGPVVVRAASAPALAAGDRVVVPAYGGPAADLAHLDATPRSRILLLESADRGRTFVERVVLPASMTGAWLMEPALVALRDGRRLLAARTSRVASPSGPGRMVLAVSLDAGRTWSDWRDLPWVGHAPDLLELADGRLLLAFRQVDEGGTRESVALAASRDDGVSWDPPRILEDCGEADCAYPSLVALPDGRILEVWYADDGHAIRGQILVP